jgi:DNA gyrase subunit A
MLITSQGKVIRMPVRGIPTLGRNTQGVRLIRVEDGETVVGVENLAEREEEAGQVQAAPVEVIEGEEDLSDEGEDGAVAEPVDGEETTETSGDDEA